MPQCRPEDYELVFGNPTGMLVLEDLLHGFHYYDPMWQTDQHVNDLIFREGQRSVVLWIRNTILAVQNGQHYDDTTEQEEALDG